MGGGGADRISEEEEELPPKLAIPDKGTLLLGKYRVEGVIGFGGMGVVLSARHEHLGERVAMKLLLPGHAGDTEVRSRFKREAQAAFMLKSEHVCRVLDAGDLEDGTPFIAMELLVGEDLAARIRRSTTLPVEDAVLTILQACDAIAEAHANDIVHRDLKPSNLIVVKRKDGTTNVKVIDFGISKVGVGRSAVSSVTRTYAYVGSPSYSAPEHLEAARNATAWSDQWSLGVVLYECLTGALPFALENDSMSAVAAEIARAAPTPMRVRNPSLPAELDAAVMRCLEKLPSLRHASIQAFAEAIAPFARQTGGEAASDLLAKIRRHAVPAVSAPDDVVRALVGPAGRHTDAAAGSVPPPRRPSASSLPPQDTLPSAHTLISPTVAYVAPITTRRQSPKSRVTTIALAAIVGCLFVLVTLVVIRRSRASIDGDSAEAEPTAASAAESSAVASEASNAAPPSGPTVAPAIATDTAPASSSSSASVSPASSAKKPKSRHPAPAGSGPRFFDTRQGR